MHQRTFVFAHDHTFERAMFKNAKYFERQLLVTAQSESGGVHHLEVPGDGFVESDAGYSPMIRMKQPATGVRRKVIKQFAPPPDDTPELHDARPIVKLFYLGTMETGQKVDRVVKARRGEQAV